MAIIKIWSLNNQIKAKTFAFKKNIVLKLRNNILQNGGCELDSQCNNGKWCSDVEIIKVHWSLNNQIQAKIVAFKNKIVLK